MKYGATLWHHNLNKSTFFSQFFVVEKIIRFYFLFESQFKGFDQILFYLYEFQMVSDILGHPVLGICKSMRHIKHDEIIKFNAVTSLFIGGIGYVTGDMAFVTE